MISTEPEIKIRLVFVLAKSIFVSRNLDFKFCSFSVVSLFSVSTLVLNKL